MEEVIVAAERARENAECLFVFGTTKHLYRSGRIPRAASQVGSVLGAKPVCRIGRDGRVHFIGVVRSRAKGVERVLRMLREHVGSRPVYGMVLHTAAADDAESLRGRVEREFNCMEVLVSEFSPVMGYAVGPGLLGVALCPETVGP
jgi:DegV family protein with EDD domain